MPAPYEITRLALRTLEDALAQSNGEPLRRKWGHRLALAWLVKAGITHPSRCNEFWRSLADPFKWAGKQDMRQVRRKILTDLLDNWHRSAGDYPLDEMQRRKWAGALTSPIDSVNTEDELERMCNRYQPGDRQAITSLFSARELRQFNTGPDTVHPKDPGWIVRLQNGERVLEQMTWGFPVTLIGKKGLPLKPRPVNNAKFDKLGTFWRRWATDPGQRCLNPTARFAEALGERGRMTETWLSVRGQPLFAWAGLWRPPDEWGDCYTGVMTDNALDFAHIHDCCPVILEPHDWHTWLTAPLADLYGFDRPYTAEHMTEEVTAKLWAER